MYLKGLQSSVIQRTYSQSNFSGKGSKVQKKKEKEKRSNRE